MNINDLIGSHHLATLIYLKGDDCIFVMSDGSKNESVQITYLSNTLGVVHMVFPYPLSDYSLGIIKYEIENRAVNKELLLSNVDKIDEYLHIHSVPYSPLYMFKRLFQYIKSKSI